MSERFRKKIFCETLFLKELSVNICESSSNQVSSYQEKKVWWSIFNLLRNTSIELHLDISDEELDMVYAEVEGSMKKNAKKGNANPAYEEIIYSAYNDQKRVQLKCDFKPLSRCIEEGIALDTDAIYFTMSSKGLFKEWSEDKGIFIISNDSINSFIPLLNDSGVSILKDDFGTWGTILKKCKKIPCNRITVVDNYILSKCDTYKKNLKQILDSLLPEKAEPGFPIAIYTVDFVDSWNSIKEIIENLERPYSISLCVVKCCEKPFHDRTIYTNNLWIGCGSGFNLFKSNNTANHSTVINIVSPFLNDTIQWAFNAYGNLIKDVEKQYSKHESYETLKNRNIPNLETGFSYKREEIIEPKKNC